MVALMEIAFKVIRCRDPLSGCGTLGGGPAQLIAVPNQPYIKEAHLKLNLIGLHG
jgi:hypothetical protein